MSGRQLKMSEMNETHFLYPTKKKFASYSSRLYGPDSFTVNPAMLHYYVADNVTNIRADW